jgi:CheY-like chemotaxis protein
MNASPATANLELPEVSPPGLEPIHPMNGDKVRPNPKRSLCILCIDDDAGVRELLTVCLAQFEHRVTVAAGGIEGIEMFRAAMLKNQPYDVVITDMGMPDVNGREVARTIKMESPGTPIVMLTGWGKSIRDDGDNISGVDIVVDKPPHIYELNDLLIRMAKPV